MKRLWGNLQDMISNHPILSRCIFILFPSIIVALFFTQYLFTGNKIRGGDFDYYAQMYEAFRISVLHFGQFPDWNPWISGGVPLYANPQFGLVSIQSFLVLIFGTIYGLKLAYMFYALCGFWGMYTFGRKIIKSNRIRSLLISFIWIACGFFYGHNISHFTFALFFLFPWLIICLHYRARRWTWLYFGGLMGAIALSSIHYAFLMMGVACVLYFGTLAIVNYVSKRSLKPLKKDTLFATGSILAFLLLTGHKLAASYYYANHNQRLIESPEKYASIGLLVKSIFTPISTLLPVPSHLQWGWAEYDMYIGIGTGLALLISLGCIVWSIVKYKKLVTYKTLLIAAIILAVVCFTLALGDFAKFSPFHLLHKLPGFTQTRVPSRWVIFVVFSLLTVIMVVKQQKILINSVLTLGALELFIFHGPLMNYGQDMFQPQNTSFSNTFTQYDNSRKHLDASINQLHSYFITTADNTGQIYADDSLVDTLDGVYNTSRCGINDRPSCGFILSNNATLVYWSPNDIKLHRTSSGSIILNMNPYYAWHVNGKNVFPNFKKLDPANEFTITDPSSNLNLTYNPKFSL